MTGLRMRAGGLGLVSGLIAVASLLMAFDAPAHGPTRQKVSEKIDIAASADKVWAVMGNFDALKDWHPAVESSAADKGNEAGSVRTIVLKGGGGVIVEVLQKYDAAGRTYSYRAKEAGPLPVSNYTSTIVVHGEGDKASVEWRGAFYRGFPGNDPPPEQNDAAAIKAITDVYVGGLTKLKSLVEGR